MRGPDPQKRRTWQERLERFARSDSTIAEFCRAEGVSIPSFYQWRRKLKSQVIDEPSQARAFVPAQVTGSAPAAVVRIGSDIVIEVTADAVQPVVKTLLEVERQGRESC